MASSPQRNHYDVLGLRPDATQAAIRTRFRELARRFHPDVASEPDAAARFRDINDAHSVLSDPQRRASYDAELKLARLKAERAAHAARPRPARPGATGGARPGGAAQRPGPASSRDRDASGVRRPARAQNPIRPGIGVVDQLTNEARRAASQMRHREAEMICRHVLRIDARNAAACEVLGDVYRARGRREDALRMYSYAVQFDPRSTAAQAKYERLIGRTQASSVPDLSLRARSARAGRMLVGGLCLAGLAVLPTMADTSDADPVGTLLWLRLSLEALLALSGAATLAGIVLASSGLLDHARDALGFAARHRHGTTVPLGPVLLLLAVAWFPLAFLAYVAAAFAQGATSQSLTRAFAATVGVTALFAAVMQPAARDLLLWGGSVAFPALVAGWFVGDAMRH